MQILIDIPEDFYEALKKTDEMASGLRSEKTLMSVVYSAVAKGTPLPEGHGRLKDVDDLDVTTIETDDYDGNEVLDVVLKEDIDEAPTIIEADKEKRDADSN